MDSTLKMKFELLDQIVRLTDQQASLARNIESDPTAVEQKMDQIRELDQQLKTLHERLSTITAA